MTALCLVNLAAMLPTIYEDARAHPLLFRWFGVSRPEFEAWLTALPLRIHPGLVEFWRRTGGGDLFESETILGPLVADESDNVLALNEYHWSKGLPRNMLIFHIGLNVSASFVDQRRHRNRLVSFKPDSYDVEKSFDTFGAWYRENLRSEYGARYGLQPP
jgi:hypothetical protein